MKKLNDYLTVGSAASYFLGVSKDTLKGWNAAGMLKAAAIPSQAFVSTSRTNWRRSGLLCDSTTESFEQIQRNGPEVFPCKGETAKNDRKWLH